MTNQTLTLGEGLIADMKNALEPLLTLGDFVTAMNTNGAFPKPLEAHSTLVSVTFGGGSATLRYGDLCLLRDFADKINELAKEIPS